MLTLTDATRLLDATTDLDGCARIADALGFHAPPLPLDAEARERLGLPHEITDAQIIGGDGLLRVLVLSIDAHADVRAVLAVAARRIGQRVPHLLWLAVAMQLGGSTVAIGTWTTTQADVRVATLLTRRGNVIASDAETVCALAAATECAGGDVMRHLRWVDVLGRESIARRFFRALERAVTTLAQSLPPHVPLSDARELALLTSSRLLFLSFLEAKGWLDGDFGFLANGFAACMTDGGSYHRRVLDPLFFGTLNTTYRKRAPRARAFGRIPFLNGGLFARSALERTHRHARFSDDALGELFGEVLVCHRFTPREDARGWSEAAIDPEVLGRAFESLMAPSDRKRHGVHFTPQPLVEQLALGALGSALACDRITSERVEALLDGAAPTELERTILLPRARSMTILDPACGSGAFLVHVLERLAVLRSSLGESLPLTDVRRSVLTRCIFGVDVNPTAVWLCELRLWLSAVIDSDERDPMRVVPLPNLDHNIRVGDSLAGRAFDTDARVPEPLRIRAIRQRYTRAVGRRKISLARTLDSAERERAMHELERRLASLTREGRELVETIRGTDLFATRRIADSRSASRLEQLRRMRRTLRATRTALQRGGALPFSYASHFSDIADAGGFSLVIGNPPWVRFGNIAPEQREQYRDTFATVSHAAWRDGAADACASIGFASQADLAALFVERGHDLIAPHGTLAYLLPAKLWRSLSGGGCRRILADDMHVVLLEDCSDAPAMFDAAVYPSLVVARHLPGTTQRQPLSVGVHRRGTVTRWRANWRDVVLDDSSGSPWLLVPRAPRAAFDRVERAGTPLGRTAFGRPWLGVKSGCNDAFVVHRLAESDGIARVTSAGRTEEIEAALLRPLVRGETLSPWRVNGTAERIVWTHDATGPLRVLPAGGARWLAVHRRTLERRSDARSAGRWWSLFRTESADCRRARVIWSDFGRTPRAAVLAAGDPTVPLNTCYTIACPSHHDALALTALLNSPLAAAWLHILAEPARGGYRRYLGWTMTRFPLPAGWDRARDILAPLADAAMQGAVPSPFTLQQAVLSSYRLRGDVVAPLLEWAASEP